MHVVKRGKCSPTKFSNFVVICITRGNLHHIWAESGAISRPQYKLIQNLQILLGYIFLILQHFAAKLCNFTNFNMLFLAVLTDFVLLVVTDFVLLVFWPKMIMFLVFLYLRLDCLYSIFFLWFFFSFSRFIN